jgi:thiamine pyrophosphate-dependent acetolactate synthase large subunit-like protein
MLGEEPLMEANTRRTPMVVITGQSLTFAIRNN